MCKKNGFLKNKKKFRYDY